MRILPASIRFDNSITTYSTGVLVLTSEPEGEQFANAYFDTETKIKMLVNTPPFCHSAMHAHTFAPSSELLGCLLLPTAVAS